MGPYRSLERLGEGGMGVVYRGLDPAGGEVAIKVLRPEIALDETARSRLEREVDTMRRIRSPHVAEVLGADASAAPPYVVTRYVPGKPLDAVVAEKGPLQGEDLRRLAVGLARALAAIHAAGVVHRDVKPGNVMLVDGEPIVIDFGIAQAVDATRLTGTGLIIGSPGYLAPEVINHERATPASDVHAWAATVAYAATGRPPFGSGSVEVVFFNILHGRAWLGGVPSRLVPVLRAALAYDPARRPPATALAEKVSDLDLMAVDRPTPTVAYTRRVSRPAPPPLHGKRRAVVLALAIGAAGLLMFAGSLMIKGGSTAVGGSRTKAPEWPKGASRAAILAPILNGIRECARATVTNPANCPQAGPRPMRPHEVGWKLHGDPLEGAEVTFDKGRFAATGRGVMALRYREDFMVDHPEIRVVTFGYKATVDWKQGRAKLVSIVANNYGTPPTVKKDPGLPQAQIKQAVRDTFARCVATRSVNQAAECPIEARSSPKYRTTWSLDGDPLRNASITFDSGYGVLHVVSSYAMTARYARDGIFVPQPQYFSGTYDAWVIAEGGRPLVLRIEQTRRN